MASGSRRVFIISDLHLGGNWPKEGASDDHGFRMMTNPDVLTDFIHTLSDTKDEQPTELVINGDFVDFLAEEHDEGDRWKPFVSDPAIACKLFQRMLKRDRQVFDALRHFVSAGHRLTILLGNHDIELSLPPVRRRLEQALDLDRIQHRCRFIYDGEGYVIGDALIEHGNRYDAFNLVDQDGLRRVRSLLSRQQAVGPAEFSPPPGSRLVAEVINPIKQSYPFVDLLKPESVPLVALLLAIEPSLKRYLASVARALLGASPEMRRAEPALPNYGRNMGSRATGRVQELSERNGISDEQAIRKVLTPLLSQESLDQLLGTRDPSPGFPDFGRSMGSTKVGPLLSLAQLTAGGSFGAANWRMDKVRDCLRLLQNDCTFDDSKEPSLEYLSAAQAMTRAEGAGTGFGYVIFGHTHHAKHIRLSNGGTYLNSGTWANLMRFPAELSGNDDQAASEKLRQFVEDLRQGRLTKYLEFRPTFVRLEVSSEARVVEANVFRYKCKASILADEESSI